MYKRCLPIIGVVFGLLLLAPLSGSAAQLFVSSFPAFNRSRPPQTVEDALLIGDGIRDEMVRAALELGDWVTASARYEEAKNYYTYILDELEPHNAYAALNLGYMPLVLLRIAPGGERDILSDVAQAKFTEAAQKRKGYADAYRYLGELYAVEKEWDKAIAEFSKLQGSKAEDAHIHAWWAYCLLKKGTPQSEDEAKAHLRKAIERGVPEACVTWAKKYR